MSTDTEVYDYTTLADSLQAQAAANAEQQTARRERRHRVSHRNSIPQRIAQADGSRKMVFHDKPFWRITFHQLWHNLNTTKVSERAFK